MAGDPTSRVRARPSFGILAALAAIGCGARTGLASEEAAMAEVSSGFVVRMVVFVNAVEHDWANATETLVVEVEDDHEQPLAGAVVRAGTHGSAVDIPYREATKRFELERLGYSEVYEIVVTHGADSAEGVVTGPPPHATSIDPDPLVAGAPATVRWSPVAAGVTASVQVQGPESGWEQFDGEVEALGAYELPADTFSVPGAWLISVARTSESAASLGAERTFGTVAIFDEHATHAE
jgi:hypothetical protein